MICLQECNLNNKYIGLYYRNILGPHIIGKDKQLILKICSKDALVMQGKISLKSIILHYSFKILIEFFDRDYFNFLKLYNKDLTDKSQTNLSN